MTNTSSAAVVAAPLGSVAMGRLVFVRGAAHLRIGVDASMEDLYRARFEGKVPDVRVDGGRVTVKYRPSLHPPHGEITLSGRVPWAINASMGMSDVVADLQESWRSGAWRSPEAPPGLRSSCLARRRPSQFGSVQEPATSN